MSLPPFRVLDYEVEARVATLRLNRPHKRNALSAELVNELLVALELADAAADVRAIVLTGAGGVFCSGGDLSQLQAPDSDGWAVPYRGGFVELNQAMARLGTPVIARIERYALAGGLGLVCGCHFALAEREATFGTPEIRRGLFPMMILAPMSRVVPRRQLLRLVLSGQRVSAEEAVRIGLITEAVPAGELDAAVERLASTLVRNPPEVTRRGLAALSAIEGLSLDEALPRLEEELLTVLGTPEAQEGLLAFLEKREPSWR